MRERIGGGGVGIGKCREMGQEVERQGYRQWQGREGGRKERRGW